jgi:glycosyltransferase involved in cell wall biosynthesis
MENTIKIKWFQIKKWIDRDNPIIKFLAFKNKVNYIDQYIISGSPNIEKYIEDIIYFYSKETNFDTWIIKETALISRFSNPLELFKIKANNNYKVEEGKDLVLKLIQLFANLKLKKIDTIIFVPWLKTGGADLHVTLLAKASILNKKNCLVIATENTTSEWKDQIGTGNSFINISLLINKVPILTFINVFRVFLKLWQVKNIHVMNSHFGWRLIENYGINIKKICKLTTSLFCYDYSVYGEPIGYARYLDKLKFEFDLILTDNTPFKEHLVGYYGVNPDTVKVLQHPIEVNYLLPKTDKNGPILWAGRLDDQKNISMLLEIAKKRSDLCFEVYGSSVTDKNEKISELFTGIKNVAYKGPFNNLKEIPVNKYSIFLYTSKWDGLPNIVLEMCALKIPVICPKIGGLGFDLPEKYIYLVNDPFEANEFIKRIEEIKKNYLDALQKAEQAQIFIIKNFNFKNLSEKIREIDY